MKFGHFSGLRARLSARYYRVAALIVATAVVGTACGVPPAVTPESPATSGASTAQEPSTTQHPPTDAPPTTTAISVPTVNIDGWSQEAQDELGDWVSEIYDAVGSDPGYGDIGVDYREMAVDVEFRGPFPPSADPVIAAAKTAGVAIRKIDINYSQRDFDQVAHQLAKALDAAGIDGVTSIGPSRGFAHLEIAGPAIETDAELQDQVTRLLREITTMPFTFEYGEADIDLT